MVGWWWWSSFCCPLKYVEQALNKGENHMHRGGFLHQGGAI